MVKVLRTSLSLMAAVLCLASALHFGAVPVASQLNYRSPVVLSIAPDAVDCDNPDDPEGLEDVQIAGLCFLGSITSAYLTLNADGSGTQIQLGNVVHVASNVITATVPLGQLTQRNTPYYVFVVRGSDGKVSTPYPNAFGFDVTFTCVQELRGDPPPLTSCRAVRTSEGRYVLQVNGIAFRPNVSRVLLNGTPCRRNKYPQRFINPNDGLTTRINCYDNLRQLLPATVTVEIEPGVLSQNSINCDLP